MLTVADLLDVGVPFADLLGEPVTVVEDHAPHGLVRGTVAYRGRSGRVAVADPELDAEPEYAPEDIVMDDEEGALSMLRDAVFGGAA